MFRFTQLSEGLWKVAGPIVVSLNPWYFHIFHTHNRLTLTIYNVVMIKWLIFSSSVLSVPSVSFPPYFLSHTLTVRNINNFKLYPTCWYPCYCWDCWLLVKLFQNSCWLTISNSWVNAKRFFWGGKRWFLIH